MSILVTGGLGYIGSHVVKALVDRGEDVIIVDNLSTGHIKAVESCEGKLEVRIADINDSEELINKIFTYSNIEAVIHLAASADVPDSVVHPSKYYSNNVANTINLLNAMASFSIDKLIFSSTAAVYGNSNIPCREHHEARPTNPYGRSKLMCEQIIKDYEKAYNLRSISFRYFCAAGARKDQIGDTVYCFMGEDHRPEKHLIPNAIKTALGQQDSITVYGDGSAIRDFVHVEDIAQAHLLALNALRAGASSNVYNLGNDQGYSVKQIIAYAERITAQKIKIEYADPRPGDPEILIADASKARKHLGWRPRHDIGDILHTALWWHFTHPVGYGTKFKDN